MSGSALLKADVAMPLTLDAQQRLCVGQCVILLLVLSMQSSLYLQS